MTTPGIWYELYKAALLETDPKKSGGRIQAAQSAVRDRERALSCAFVGVEIFFHASEMIPEIQL